MTTEMFKGFPVFFFELLCKCDHLILTDWMLIFSDWSELKRTGQAKAVHNTKHDFEYNDVFMIP